MRRPATSGSGTHPRAPSGLRTRNRDLAMGHWESEKPGSKPAYAAIGPGVTALFPLYVLAMLAILAILSPRGFVAFVIMTIVIRLAVPREWNHLTRSNGDET